MNEQFINLEVINDTDKIFDIINEQSNRQEILKKLENKEEYVFIPFIQKNNKFTILIKSEIDFKKHENPVLLWASSDKQVLGDYIVKLLSLLDDDLQTKIEDKLLKILDEF